MSNGYDSIKFLCDGTVGKLARLLRMIGIDTEVCPSTKPQEVISAALECERRILSRNSAFTGIKLARDVTVLDASDPWKQLDAILKTLKIKIERDRLLTRCLRDNTRLETVDKESVKNEIYPYVFETQETFNRCPRCGRIYWPGTHVNAMFDKLKEKGYL